MHHTLLPLNERRALQREYHIRALTVLCFTLSLAGIIGGAFFVETLLGIPGIGSFLFEAARSRDYDTIMASTVIFATVFVVMNLLTELTYAFIDPRVRLGAAR